MDTQEYNAWRQFMLSSRGHWTVDPIHNGKDRDDLIFFRCNPTDATAGVFIMVNGREVTTGKFEDAGPCLSDGVFNVCWSASFPKGRDDALSFVLERVGLSALLALTHGRSPYYSS